MQRVHPFVNFNIYKYCGQDEHEMNHPSDQDSWTCDLAIDYGFNPRPIDVPQTCSKVLVRQTHSWVIPRGTNSNSY